MLPICFDRRYYINTLVQATDTDLQNSAVAQHHTIYTRQLTNLFDGSASDQPDWIILPVTLWVVEKLNSVIIGRFN